MTTTQTDIENYQKFGDSKKGSAVFANTLAERLKQRFPQREFRVRHYDPQAMSDYSGQAIYSDVVEVTGRVLGIFPRKTLVAHLWAGYLPCDCRNGISITPTDLRTVVEEETAKLNEVSGAGKKVFYD